MKLIAILLLPLYLPVHFIGRVLARKYQDEQFGKFIHDRFLKKFSASVPWDGRRVSLTVPSNSDGPVPGTLDVARKVWANSEEWDRKNALRTAKQHLEICNDNWRDPDVEEYTTEDFLKRMSLDEIEVNADGSLEFWYNDGGLFLGHSFLVWVNADLTIKRVDVAG